MKKTLLILISVVFITATNAQDGNNICVWNAVQNYNGGGGPDDLERGIKCSDEAAANESTLGKSKTWFFRGQLYTLISTDKTLKTKYLSASLEAVKSFKKLYDLNDPKFKDWDDVYKYLLPLGNNVFNAGVDQYQAKNYAQAYRFFYSIKDVNTVLEGRKQKGTIELSTALKNAALCAENAGDTTNAMNVYKEWLDYSHDSTAYYNYAKALLKVGKGDDAQKIIDEGLKKYPKDARLLAQKINFFLQGSKYVEALNFVNSLLELDPKNDNALFVKGIAYEKIGNEDSLTYYYSKAIEINPKNGDAYTNLGAYFVNKANTYVEKMNKLGNSAEDTKKYNELKKEQKDLYIKAKPYLSKANELNPNDAQISRILKQIDLYTKE